MRVLPIMGLLAGCTSQNVAPLVEFGPMTAYVDVELGPLVTEFRRPGIDPRVQVSLSHDNPDCPVLDEDDTDASIDGVRADSFYPGNYDEGGGWGHDSGPSCQPPFFAINKVPAAMASSTLRLADATAEMTLVADRLFVNPEMTIASPLLRGQLAVIDVADDRPIKTVEAMWWVGTEDSATGYDVMPMVSSNVIEITMPTETSGPGWLEVRVVLAPSQPTCIGFSECFVTVKGSAKFDARLD